MAFTRVEPVQVHVRTGWFDGRPREITWGDLRLPVTRLASSARRPRRIRSSPDRARCSRSRRREPELSLTYHHRSRRWTVTGLDDAVRPAA